MLSFARNLLTPSNGSVTHGVGHVLWIDGVGCFWVLTKDRVVLGRADVGTSKSTESPTLADLPILSDLKRQHATIVRASEGYVLEAHGPAKVSAREVDGRVPLVDGAVIELGRGVRLQFRLPTTLSLSARLDFVSDHRPLQSLDGVVLLADTCVLGPAEDSHVVCNDWPGAVLLVKQANELLCRSRLELTIDGRRLGNGHTLRDGDVVQNDEVRFRIEQRV